MFPYRVAPFSSFCPGDWRALALAGCMTVALTGCDRLPFKVSDRAFDEAGQKKNAHAYREAIDLYEKSLDGTTHSADAHFRMGLIYDENLSDPIAAVYQFKRYLEIQPSGPHTKEAKANLDRIEPMLATSLANGTLISHTEAMALKKENQDLRTQLAARPPAPAAATSPASGVAAGKTAAHDAQQKLAPGSRTYVVEKGDTLAAISRKFYKNPMHARDIQDANMNTLPDPKKLKPGQVLIIP